MQWFSVAFRIFMPLPLSFVHPKLLASKGDYLYRQLLGVASLSHLLRQVATLETLFSCSKRVLSADK